MSSFFDISSVPFSVLEVNIGIDFRKPFRLILDYQNKRIAFASRSSMPSQNRSRIQ
jgi:hypothetical protein